MSIQKTSFDSQRLTIPIHLITVWVVGLMFLTLISLIFVSTAGKITQPQLHWVAAMLAVAGVSFVPLFLLAIFLMQTIVRPNLQEDKYFSQWLRDSQPRAQDTTANPLPPQSSATAEPLEGAMSKEAKRILRTLWRYQKQVCGEGYNKRWTFGVHPLSPDYATYLRGLSEVVQHGFVAVSPENYQCMLTNEGIQHLRNTPELHEGDEVYSF